MLEVKLPKELEKVEEIGSVSSNLYVFLIPELLGNKQGYLRFYLIQQDFSNLVTMQLKIQKENILANFLLNLAHSKQTVNKAPSPLNLQILLKISG
jgi:hypothetical protein